jgi:hypothetical protein
MSTETFRLRERPQITVIRLSCQPRGNHAAHLLKQPWVVGHSQRLDGRDEIFADKFTRPRHQLGRGLTIAQQKHLQHPRIRLGCSQQPIIDIDLHASADRAAKLEVCCRQGITPEVRSGIRGGSLDGSEQADRQGEPGRQFHGNALVRGCLALFTAGLRPGCGRPALNTQAGCRIRSGLKGRSMTRECIQRIIGFGASTPPILFDSERSQDNWQISCLNANAGSVTRWSVQGMDTN